MLGRNNGPFTESFSPVSGEHSGNGKENDSKKKKIYLVETAAGLRRAFLPFPESTPETGQIFCVKKRKIFCVKKRKNYRVETTDGTTVAWFAGETNYRPVSGEFSGNGKKNCHDASDGEKIYLLGLLCDAVLPKQAKYYSSGFLSTSCAYMPYVLAILTKNSQLLEKQLSTKLAYKSQH